MGLPPSPSVLEDLLAFPAVVQEPANLNLGGGSEPHLSLSGFIALDLKGARTGSKTVGWG